MDLFYVHRRQPELPIEEVAGTLGRLVRKGQNKNDEFSEIAPSSLRRADKVHHVAAYNLNIHYQHAPELGLSRTCATGHNIGAFSPVGRTLLTTVRSALRLLKVLIF